MKKGIILCIILTLSISISSITKREFLNRYTKGKILVVIIDNLPRGVIGDTITIESDGTIYAIKGREQSVKYFKKGEQLKIKSRTMRKKRFEFITIFSEDKKKHKWMLYYDDPDQLARNMEKFFTIQSAEKHSTVQKPEKPSTQKSTPTDSKIQKAQTKSKVSKPEKPSVNQDTKIKPKVQQTAKQSTIQKTKITPKVQKSEKKPAIQTTQIITKKEKTQKYSTSPGKVPVKKKMLSRREFLNKYARGRFLVLQLNGIPITLNGGRININRQGRVQKTGKLAQNAPHFKKGDILEIKSRTLAKTTFQFTTLAVQVGGKNSPNYINSWTFNFENPGQLIQNTEKYFTVNNSVELTKIDPESKIEITEGMTIEQVKKLLGEPKKIARIGIKVLFKYDDWKITFVDGKVTEVSF